jgi:hypothetical protein
VALEESTRLGEGSNGGMRLSYMKRRYERHSGYRAFKDQFNGTLVAGPLLANFCVVRARTEVRIPTLNKLT